MSKRSRRLRLSPANLPEIRDRLAARMRADLEASGDWGAPFRAMMERAWGAADSLRTAPAWWVSAEMAALAVASSSGGMPDTVLPATSSGFVAFERPLPEGLSGGLGVAVRALHWTSEPAGGGSHRIRLTYFTSDKGALAAAGEKGLPLLRADVPGPAAAPRGLDDVVRAVWALSAEPTLADVSELRAPALPAGRGPRPDPMARTVKFLVLRESARDPSGGAPPDRGGPSHRFVVRGHWRNQPCGPRNSERRLKWVRPHVKGPEGARLVVRETVRVWRR